METVLIIDGDNIVNRAFYAIPPMAAPDGTPTNAIRGFCNTVLNLQEQSNATQIICAFDGGTPEFRKVAAPSYKANRKEKAEELVCQLEICRSLISPALGWNTLHKEKVEADDLLYTMTLRCAEAKVNCVLASGDKDIAQCLKIAGTKLLRPPKKSVEPWLEITEANVEEVFGVQACQIAEFLALTGDSCDNLPGIPGVGPKTAIGWLKSHKTTEALLNDPELKPERLAKALTRELIAANLLVTQGYDTGHALPEKRAQRESVISLLKDLGLHRIAARVTQKPKAGQSELF